jgi:DNA-binding transcriptional LysR family regulator
MLHDEYVENIFQRAAVFFAVAPEKSFTRTAANLGVS